MSSAQDVRFSEDKVAQGQQLTNKLWNAAPSDPARCGSRCRARWRRNAAARIDGSFRAWNGAGRGSPPDRALRLRHAALALYEFVYGELCDWYLELVKPRLRERDPELASTLLHVLTETVALAHPLIPFETEEIYSHLPGVEGLLAARVGEQARRSGGRARRERRSDR